VLGKDKDSKRGGVSKEEGDVSVSTDCTNTGSLGASEDTVDGEGLEFRTPKGGVCLDTLKSSEPVKSKVMGKAPSKLKEFSRDAISVNRNLLVLSSSSGTPHFPKINRSITWGCSIFFVYG